MTSLDVSWVDMFVLRTFVALGCVYFVVSIVDICKWWSDENDQGN